MDNQTPKQHFLDAATPDDAKLASTPLEGKGVYLSYVQHYHAALRYLNEPRDSNDIIAGILFTAICLEGYLNHLNKTMRLWTDGPGNITSLPQKINLVKEELGIKTMRRQPASDDPVRKLINLRNYHVHPQDREVFATLYPEDPENGVLYWENDDFSNAVFMKQNPEPAILQQHLQTATLFIRNIHALALKRGFIENGQKDPFSSLVNYNLYPIPENSRA